MKQAHGGIGSSSHMACLLFTSEAQVKPNLVAYRGTGPAMNDLIGGHVDFFCDQAVSVTGQILSGTVKAYAISGDKRLATLPGRADREGTRRRLPHEYLGRRYSPRRAPTRRS